MQLHELLESVTLLIMTELKSNVFEERKNNRKIMSGGAGVLTIPAVTMATKVSG